MFPFAHTNAFKMYIQYLDTLYRSVFYCITMKNGPKEPDWGKYGLDGEKQPLNPGSSKIEHAEAKTSKDLYGAGQIVNDNELFADDQVIIWIKMFSF